MWLTDKNQGKDKQNLTDDYIWNYSLIIIFYCVILVYWTWFFLMLLLAFSIFCFTAAVSCWVVRALCRDVSPRGSCQTHWSCATAASLYVVCFLSFVYRLVVCRSSLNCYLPLLFNVAACCSLFTDICCCLCLLTPSFSSSCSSFLCKN